MGLENGDGMVAPRQILEDSGKSSQKRDRFANRIQEREPTQMGWVVIDV